MDPQRWQDIKDLFAKAEEMSAGECAGFLDRACAGDSKLRAEVEALLRRRDEADDFLNEPAIRWLQIQQTGESWNEPARSCMEQGRSQFDRPLRPDVNGGFAAVPESAALEKQLAVATSAMSNPVSSLVRFMLPAAIGRYRIVRLIEEGGMGTVYEAEQDQPRRIVALKVIRGAIISPELLWRFEQEAQVLGRLQHPGIAQIYEAGTADSGFGPQPYFAMEFIRGASLLEYADAHDLNTRQRLELTVKICEAVHHAHQRGIIHRDLKPGNILVEESGQPKILDFGVARVTDKDAQATRQTDLGQMIGTLAYMSPEQVLGDPLELDIRTDVYSLGVILFELLTGRLPYKIGDRLHEAVQTIRDEDPTPLSSIESTCRGDIEIIVAKTLEKDKARRYSSAIDLSADIRRYLQHEPILARRPNSGYFIKKFIRRNRVLVAGIAAVFVVLVSGIAVSAWQATVARHAELAAVSERNRADAESATAKAINDFLQNDLLAQASPLTQAGSNNTPNPELTVRTALDRASGRITGKFSKQPLLEAAIRETIGNTYAELGLVPEAERELKYALALRQHFLGDEHHDTLEVLDALGALYREFGKYVQAEPLITRVLAARRRTLGEDHLQTLSAMYSLAMLYRNEGKYAQAEPLFDQLLSVRRRVQGNDHTDTLSTMASLGALYVIEGKYVQAEPLLTHSLSVRRQVHGAEHPDTLAVAYHLADLYEREGKYEEAESLFTQILPVKQRVLGTEHPYTLNSMNGLAIVYSSEGKYEKAASLFEQAVAIERRVMGQEDPYTLDSMNDLARVYLEQHKYVQAEPLIEQVMEITQRTLGKEHPLTLSSRAHLALLYEHQNRHALADEILVSVLQSRRRLLGEDHLSTLRTMNDLALVYVHQRKYAQAEPLFIKLISARARVLGEEHPETLRAKNGLALLYRYREYGKRALVGRDGPSTVRP